MSEIGDGNTYHKKRLSELRRKILTAAYLSKDGHVPSSFSILECLYSIFIVYPKYSHRQYLTDFDFFLSKGHASLALYAILEEAK